MKTITTPITQRLCLKFASKDYTVQADAIYYKDPQHLNEQQFWKLLVILHEVGKLSTKPFVAKIVTLLRRIVNDETATYPTPNDETA